MAHSYPELLMRANLQNQQKERTRRAKTMRVSDIKLYKSRKLKLSDVKPVFAKSPHKFNNKNKELRKHQNYQQCFFVKFTSRNFIFSNPKGLKNRH
jgi:hypothetical protein